MLKVTTVPIPSTLATVDAVPIWTNVDATETIMEFVIVPGPTTLMELTPAITPVVSETKITVDPIPTGELIVVVRKFIFPTVVVDANATWTALTLTVTAMPTLGVKSTFSSEPDRYG